MVFNTGNVVNIFYDRFLTWVRYDFETKKIKTRSPRCGTLGRSHLINLFPAVDGLLFTKKRFPTSFVLRFRFNHRFKMISSQKCYFIKHLSLNFSYARTANNTKLYKRKNMLLRLSYSFVYEYDLLKQLIYFILYVFSF